MFFDVGHIFKLREFFILNLLSHENDFCILPRIDLNCIHLGSILRVIDVDLILNARIPRVFYMPNLIIFFHNIEIYIL